MVSLIVAKQKWHALSERHLQMADHLLNVGRTIFHDGAVFHAYHAYECILNAIIAANGYLVPPDGWYRRRGKRYYRAPVDFEDKGTHNARLEFARQLIKPVASYYTSYLNISTYVNTDYRNDSLYYVHNRLPEQRFTFTDAQLFFRDVENFVDEVWRDIG